MNKIHVEMLTEDALLYIKKNLEFFTKKIIENDDNVWIKSTIPGIIYVEKVYTIDDFELTINEKSADKQVDYENAIKLYENLKHLPRYILTDVRFWLWLMLDKFYVESKSFMEIKGSTTIKDHWLDNQNRRRALFFGVLSRLYFRVERTCIDDNYELTKWIFENPERFRNLSWRTYSDNKDIVIACIKGCKKAFEETNIEDHDFYANIAKYIGFLGSANLLDAYSIDELTLIVYNKYIKLIEEKNESERIIQD